jgi:hypothetical protein
MLDQFLARVSSELQQAGYVVESDPRIPGVQALLYARSTGRFRIKAAKVEQHLLFVDWDNAAFGRLDQLEEMYRRFSSYANQGFKTPHALRLQIPSLAIIAITQDEFSEEALAFARTTSLNPWYGGEVGQVILVNLPAQQVASLGDMGQGGFPLPGAFALWHALGLVRRVCERAFVK